MTITALRDGEGRLRGFAKLTRDITERKTAEDRVRESLRARVEAENFYKEVGELVPYGIWINRYPEGDNIFLSQCYLDMVGMTREEHQGYGWKTSLHPDDRETCVGKWLDFLRSGQTDWEEEFRVRDKEGKYHTILGRGRPIRNKEGEIMAYGGVNFDITRRKAVEESLSQLNATLEQRVAEQTVEVREALETVNRERRRLYDVLETVPAMVCLLTPDYQRPSPTALFERNSATRKADTATNTVSGCLSRATSASPKKCSRPANPIARRSTLPTATLSTPTTSPSPTPTRLAPHS